MSSPEEVTARWKELVRVSDLTTARRLATKVSMSPEAVSKRWRGVEALRKACLAFARAGTRRAPPAPGGSEAHPGRPPDGRFR